jgi:hypothetical protein
LAVGLLHKHPATHVDPEEKEEEKRIWHELDRLCVRTDNFRMYLPRSMLARFHCIN